ncbi:MAG: hypothetical protein JOZ74_12675 [Bradyrhizobium sp.]|nr:hypothetical protein [Bradyrhizobium sp.]
MDTHAIHLVRVTTDDRTHRLWAAATSREEAVDRVLDAIPEGWAARLLEPSLPPREAAVQGMRPGDVRELRDKRSATRP